MLASQKSPQARLRKFAKVALAGIAMLIVPIRPTWALRIHVDPNLGADEPERDGGPSLPFRTVTYAIARAGARGASGELEILLGPGEYREVDPFSPELGGETFPLRLPACFSRISLRAAGGTSGASSPAFVGASYELGLLEIAREGADESADVELEGIAFSGGAVAVGIFAGREAVIAAKVVRCTLEDQSLSAVEVQAAPKSQVSFVLEGSAVRRSGGGVLAETSREAFLDLRVEGSQIEDLKAYGPAGLLGSAVDVHVESRAHAEVSVARNALRGVSSGLQLTSAEPDPSDPFPEAAVSARFVGNLVAGRILRGGPSDPGVRAKCGVYLSLWPHHEIDLLIASNTFAEIAGPVVFHDNLGPNGAAGPCPLGPENPARVPFTFVNNLCYRILADSEFDIEVPGACFPPEGVRILCNLLEKSALGWASVSGNRSQDPLLVDPDAGDFRPRPDSPAVDSADSAYSDLALLDLDGRCRRSLSTCRLDLEAYPMDVGAYEAPGFCDRDVRPFVRGDCDQDAESSLEISDAIFSFSHLFLGGRTPASADACDANDDGSLDLTDGIYTLAYLFLGGPPPPEPFEELGTDPTRDCLEP